MKITEEVRGYAAEDGLTEAEAVDSGMRQKTEEFFKGGAEIYVRG